MKKILLLFVATASLLVSCSSDDNSSDNTEVSLIGKWEAKSYDLSYTLNGMPIQAENVDADFEGVVGSVFEFNSDNTFKVTTYDRVDENNGQWYTDEGTYVYNQTKNEISLIYDNDYSDIVKLQVLSLTSSKLNFRMQYSEVDSDGEYVFKMDVNCIRK